MSILNRNRIIVIVANRNFVARKISEKEGISIKNDKNLPITLQKSQKIVQNPILRNISNNHRNRKESNFSTLSFCSKRSEPKHSTLGRIT